MRFRGVRRLGAIALSLFLLSGLPACSGQQQQEEGLEATNEQGANEEGAAENEGGQGNAAGADNEGGGENEQGGGENQASEGDEEGGSEESAEGSGNATENDLQDIIQEMNGSGEGSNATANTPPLQQDGANAAPPVENTPPANPAPVAEAAPAPAPAAAESGGTPPPFQPGGTPAGKNLPEIGSKMAYIVQKGDTLAKISSKIYGSNNRWNELAQLSGISNPSRIFPGDLVFYTLDDSAVQFATAYEATQRSEAQVQAGDTLATIAKRVYGTGNAWRAIWRENDKIDNPDNIPPGSTIYYVSQGAAAAAVSKIQSQMAKVAKVSDSVKVKAKTASTAAKQAVQSTVAKAQKYKSNVASKANSQVAKIKSSILLANSQLRYDAFDILNGYGKLAVFN